MNIKHQLAISGEGDSFSIVFQATTADEQGAVTVHASVTKANLTKEQVIADAQEAIVFMQNAED